MSANDTNAKDAYTLTKALRERYYELVLNSTKAKQISRAQLINRMAQDISLLLTKLDKKALSIRSRSYTFSEILDTFNVAYAPSYYKEPLSKVVFNQEELWEIISKIESKWRKEIFLCYLEQLVQAAADNARHYMVSIYHTATKYIDLESIRSYALEESLIPLLEFGLVEKDFFSGANLSRKYPEETLAFLRKHKLLEQDDFLSWELAIRNDHAQFKPDSNTQVDYNRLEALLIEIAPKRPTDCWDWLMPYLPDTISDKLAQAYWKVLLADLPRGQSHMQFIAKYHTILSRAQIPVEQLRADLDTAFKGVHAELIRDMSLRAVGLRLGKTPLASVLPVHVIEPLCRGIEHGDRASKCAHTLSILFLTNPDYPREQLEKFAQRLSKRHYAGFDADLQMLFTHALK